MSLKNLFYYTYWFKVPVIATRSVFWVMLSVLLGLLALGLVAIGARGYLEKKGLGNFSRKVSSFGISMGISGLVLFFFRQQSAPVLGWRIWFLVWGVSLIIWAAVILQYYFKRVPAIKAEQSARQEKEKYLPSGK